MRGVRLGVALFVVSIAAISGAVAQSSSVIIKPHPQSGTSPTPTTLLQVLDTEYPLEAVLANEEGITSLNLLIDPAGKVYFAQVLKSGGAARLDQAAAQMAKAKWTFQPAMKDGSPAGSSALVDVVWKLPLRPADELYSEMMGFSVAGKNIVEPKPAEGGNRVRASDYPTISVRNGEQGEVALRLRIQADGSVGDVEVLDSSGHSRLDQSAISMVKDRFKYQPGLVDGMPAEMGYLSLISFFLADRPPRGGPPRFCHSRPIIGAAMRMTDSGESNDVSVAQWIHATEDGTIDDVLLQTNKGWMHVSSAMLAEYNKTIRLGPAVRRTTQTPTGSLTSGTLRARPPSCWYNGGVTLQAK